MGSPYLIDRVIEDLKKKVVQPPLSGAADVHAGPLPYRFQPIKHLREGGVMTSAKYKRHVRMIRMMTTRNFLAAGYEQSMHGSSTWPVHGCTTLMNPKACTHTDNVVGTL